MQIKMSAHATVEQKQNRFKFSETMAQFVGEHCPKGSYLVCSIFSEQDEYRKKFGNVYLRRNYWLGNFKDHIRSV